MGEAKDKKKKWNKGGKEKLRLKGNEEIGIIYNAITYNLLSNISAL